jgi:NAD(P)-dependent dehydrogenase (short-subunit alcohol dehydrogenase family)
MKSMSDENVVIVTGGTGSQGGATVTHLLAAKKVRVRVLTRNLESPKAKSLAARGVELVKGDFEDVASLRTALAGVSAAFSVQQWTEKGGTAAEELKREAVCRCGKGIGQPSSRLLIGGGGRAEKWPRPLREQMGD